MKEFLRWALFQTFRDGEWCLGVALWVFVLGAVGLVVTGFLMSMGE